MPIKKGAPNNFVLKTRKVFFLTIFVTIVTKIVKQVFFIRAGFRRFYFYMLNLAQIQMVTRVAKKELKGGIFFAHITDSNTYFA